MQDVPEHEHPPWSAENAEGLAVLQVRYRYLGLDAELLAHT